jgi:hypothetical protein
MAYLARTLITNAYYLSGMVAPDFQTMSGAQASRGLKMLNQILSSQSICQDLIPYFTLYTFNTVAGTEKYTVTGLVQLDSYTVSYTDDKLRMVSSPVSREEYWGTGRVDDLQTLPYRFNPIKTKGGMDLYFYPLPTKVYVVKLWGRFALSSVAFTTDVSLTYDLFYIAYLEHKLAYYICNQHGLNLPQATMKEIEAFEQKLSVTSPPDLSMVKVSLFGGNRGADITRTVALSVFGGWMP